MSPGCLIASLAAIAIYAYLCWVFIVAPYNLRWQARYGNLDVPKGYTIHGIDVSHHQGKINWDALSEAQIDDCPITFVIIKGTEGRTIKDPLYKHNYHEASRGRYIKGVYHFFTPSIHTGKQQAEHYLRQVRLQPGDLPPVLDIEKVGKLTRAELQAEALQWLAECEKAYGCPPIIYTNHKFYQKYLDAPEFKKYPLWMAHYYLPALPYDGQWKFWQHNDCGRLPGIKGTVDLNVYNGSLYDLQQLCLKEPATR